MKPINQLQVIYNNRLVGRLALSRKGLCVFEYSPEWLQSGFAISPFELPLRSGVFEAKAHPFDGGFGVFDDSLPDGWGMLVLHRYLQKNGINPRNLPLLDRLSLVGSTGRGALEFRPDNSLITNDEYSDFEKLASYAQQIFASENFTEGVEEFQRRGGSPGGARPKIFTRDDGKEWLVKFRATNDPESIGSQEYKYSVLAKKCGIEMPETRIFENKYFGVERFDRTQQGGKVHVVSVAGLIGADFRLSSIDYEHIFKICSVLTRNTAEMWKVYKLMIFNLLIDNKDDHAKNFAFTYRDNEWHFAPAFDLLPSDGINGYRTTSINDSITPTKDDCLTLAARVGLDPTEALSIFDHLQSILPSNF